MEEKELLDIVELLFNLNPDNNYKINLQFEDYTLEELYKSLLQIFTLGMKKFFADDKGIVNLKKIQEDDFKFINKFFNIIGFSVHYNLYSEDDYDLMIQDHFKFEHLNCLHHHRFKLKSEDIIYVIYFSIYNNNL